MQWTDHGFIINLRVLGESHLIVTVLTQGRGKMKGLVHHGQSKTKRPFLQIGTMGEWSWTSRLDDQLGFWSYDLQSEKMGLLLSNPLTCMMMSAMCKMLEDYLLEGDVLPLTFLKVMQQFWEASTKWNAEESLAGLLLWEIEFLKVLGFGLLLPPPQESASSVFYVSPRTGHAVPEHVAGDYKERLFQLPDFCWGSLERQLKSPQAPPLDELRKAWRMTTHFLLRAHVKGELPALRSEVFRPLL